MFRSPVGPMWHREKHVIIIQLTDSLLSRIILIIIFFFFYIFLFRYTRCSLPVTSSLCFLQYSLATGVCRRRREDPHGESVRTVWTENCLMVLKTKCSLSTIEIRWTWWEILTDESLCGDSGSLSSIKKLKEEIKMKMKMMTIKKAAFENDAGLKY